jgi:GNAT superfamily N-acetyltransferase
MSTVPVRIAPLSGADVVEAGTVLDAAFGRTGMGISVHLGFALQPEHWLCAGRGGQVLAVVGSHVYGGFASIGPMGVHPSAQRSGLGLAIMEELVEHLEARGCSIQFLDASAAGQHLYPKLGFLPEGETLRMRCPQPSPFASGPGARASGAGPEESGEAVALGLLEERDLEEVVAFDAPLFGAPRPDVIAAFWAGDSARSFVARNKEGRIEGYLVAGTNHIGPWTAASERAATRLLSAALALPFDVPPMLTCPGANLSAAALLEPHGFAVTERLLHMRRGGARDPRHPRYLYAQASLALG